jgi:PAS domain S-box-containing protein
MSNSPTKEFFSKAGLGYARHQIVMDDAGAPCDYRFVEVNDVFERIAGLSAGNITGKTVNEVIAKTGEPIFDWIGAYGEVAKNGAAREFEQFFATLKRWYKIQAFSPEPNHFVTIFTDITGLKQELLHTATPAGQLVFKDPEKEDISNPLHLIDKYQNELAYREFLFENDRNGLVIIDKNHKVIDVNPRFCEMTGYSPQELRTMHTWDFDALMTAEKIKQDFDIFNEVNQTFQTKHRHKNGSLYDVEVNAVSFFWKQERNVYCSCNDITERLAVEKSLSDSEMKLKMALNIAKMGYWRYELATNNVEWSDGHHLLFGIPAEAFAGNLEAVQECVHPDDRRHGEKNLLSAIEEEKPFVNYYRVVHPDGTTKWLYSYGEPVRNQNNEITHIFGITQDISGQKSSEEALHESETRFNQVAELIGEGIGIVDGNEVFRFVNPAANKIFDVEPQGLIGRSLREFLDEENYNKIIVETSKRKRKEQTSYELMITTGKGKQRFLFVTATPMNDSAGNTTGTFGVFFDITERKAAEEELRKFKTIADKANYGSIITNVHGDILYLNECYAKMHGWQMEELAGKNFSLFYPYELAQEVKTLMEILKDKGSLNAVEFTNRRKDGTTFYTLNNATLLRDKHNNPEMVASTAIDITEEKAARLELLKLTQAIRQSPVSIVITNINGEIEYVNPKFTQVTGYSFAEALGQNPRILKSGRQDEAVYLDLWQTISKGKIWRGELLNKKKNGEVFWEAVSISPILNQDAAITHYVAIKEDITGKKETEAKLAEAQRIAKLGTYELDVSTGILHVSEVMAGICGLASKRAFTIQEWISLTYLDDVEKMTHFWTVEVMEKGNLVDVEYRIVRKSDNTVRWLHTLGKLHYNDKGQAVTLIGTSRDITELKNYETQLIVAKEKAEESDRLKTAFINNISHEIRTPMGGILGFGEFMLNDNLTPAEKLDYYNIVKQSTNRLQQTITDIMDISELKAGSIIPNIGDVYIGLVMNHFLDKLKLLCAKKNILVTLDLAAEHEDIILRTDEELLSKTLAHLLSNAEKFTKSGRITFGYSVKNQWVEFFVKDTGKGIEADKLKTVFDPFMQEDISITRGYEGNGLGLSIARGIAELLGGKLWVESKKGAGSTFFFTLPLVTGSPALNPEIETETPHARGSAKPLILIAEDDEANAELMDVVIQKSGFSTLLAINGRKAVELCHQYPEISLVIMDIKMPVMNGLEATALIKEFRPDLPVVAITAHAQTGDRHRMLEAGCDDYLAKPVDINALKKLVLKMIG